MMSPKTHYKKGDWNVTCDICGNKRKRSECIKMWNGLIACTVSDCFDRKHSFEEPVKIPADSKPVRDARPLQAGTDVTVEGSSKWGSPYLINGQFQADAVWGQSNLYWGETDPTLTLR